MKHTLVLITIILGVLLAGCNLAALSTTETPAPTTPPTLGFTQPTSTPPVILSPTPTSISNLPSSSQAVLDRAALVVAALKDRDLGALAAYTHPQQGLRFSPYSSVKETDQAFPANKVSGLFNDTTVYNWGAYSGSGEPIELTFADYYAKFVYDVDFASAPQVSLNHRLGGSTSLDNSAQFYPGAMIVEYHFPGLDSTLDGMDWRSLRLVFVPENNTWYLVGIIHDQWTT